MRHFESVKLLAGLLSTKVEEMTQHGAGGHVVATVLPFGKAVEDGRKL